MTNLDNLHNVSNLCQIWKTSLNESPSNMDRRDAKGRVALPSQKNFWKSAKGGGAFSIQKFILQIFGTLNRDFWAGNWFKRVISGLRVCFLSNCIVLQSYYTYLWKSCAYISHYLALKPPCIIIYATISIIKKLQYNFSKKFIQFGSGILP